MADANDRLFTASIEREDDAYVALCPELDIASQGGSIEDALPNLREAIDLFLQAADPREVRERHGSREVRRRGSHIVMQYAEYSPH